MPGASIARRNVLHRGHAAAAPPAPPAWTATDNPTPQNTGTTSVTFTAVNIGTASADRIVVVLFNSGSAVSTGMTIGGISATKAVEESTGISGLQIWYAAVPSGTTANIVVTSGSAMSIESLLVGKLTGVTAAPAHTSVTTTTSSDPATISVNVPSTGFGIVGIYGAPTFDNGWTNATLDFSVTDANAVILSMAHDSLSGTNTVSAGGFSGAGVHMVSASWGP